MLGRLIGISIGLISGSLISGIFNSLNALETSLALFSTFSNSGETSFNASAKASTLSVLSSTASLNGLSPPLGLIVPDIASSIPPKLSIEFVSSAAIICNSSNPPITFCKS